MRSFIQPALFVITYLLVATATNASSAQGYRPDEAVKRMTVPEGFRVDLVASEPLVRQPVCIEFDDRGRLWVIQYLQYPNPNDLKRVNVDRYSRTEYDRVPKPPPHGPRGADRIMILSDTDGDGRMDHSHDFIDGLNLASGMAMGHDGVFVLNVPYLLFYPDRNRDDIPDSDPEVLLTGFGMQDAHSVANSLTWGPDGWLYGCQGSTVTAKIRGIEFQQGVWRYHPGTDKFELFCEGGGNSWGLDFDRDGNLFYSTNFGGFVMLHGVQGGYFVKSFAKHGELHNPHAYGYLEHVPHTNFQGGHVSVGGIVYQGDAFPDSFRGKYIAADLLGHGVHWHDIHVRGSTVTTAHGGELLAANDTWFAPTDVTMGPHGAIYVSDWHDRRTAHPDPDAQWDRSNGRIYRIAPIDHQPAPSIDFAGLDVDELLALHQHPSQWSVRHARQELVRRRDRSAIAPLQEKLSQATDEKQAIEMLWSLYAVGGFSESLAEQLLDSQHAAIRYWTLRFLGDESSVSAAMAERLDRLAEQEADVWVRQQLACTAARLPANQAIPVVNANIIRDIDNDDPYLPLLWWWAVERHSVDGRDEVMRRFVRQSLWRSELGRDFLLPRLIRRYAAEGTTAGFDSVLELSEAAPDAQAQDSLWAPLLLGLRQSKHTGLSRHSLAGMISASWQSKPHHKTLTQLAILGGDQTAVEVSINSAIDVRQPAKRRVDALESLKGADAGVLLKPLLKLVQSEKVESVQLAALDLLARVEDPQVIDALINAHHNDGSETLKSKIRDTLLSRRQSALAWLDMVERGELAADVTPVAQVRKALLFDDPKLKQLVRKHWGQFDAVTREDALAEVRRLNNDLNAAAGDAGTGRQIFTQHCAVCHQLFGEGKKVGPDLTTANRTDRTALLVSLVAPSSVIRKEYASISVLTTDGRILTGLPIEHHASGITLVDQKGVATRIAASDIESTRESNVSLMPRDLYRLLTPQQLRDLFAWLQSPGPGG